MADEQPQPKPLDSAYLYNADAAAIYATAPSLDEGLSSLSEALQNGNWDNQDKAQGYARDYANKLAQKFPKEAPQVFSAENIPQIAPVQMKDVQADANPKSSTDYGAIIAGAASAIVPALNVFGDSPVDKYAQSLGGQAAGGSPDTKSADTTKAVSRINNWEKANLDQLATTKDPAYATNRDLISDGIKSYASKLRQQTQGTNESFLADTYNREIEGATGNILKLVGADQISKNLYEHTDPTLDSSTLGKFQEKLASVLGSTGGFVGASFLGPLGFYGYAAAQGAGAVEQSYGDSLKATGDSGRATIAGGLEALSQGAALFGGSLASSAAKGLTAAAIKNATEATTKAVGETFGPEVAQTNAEWIGKLVTSGMKIGALNTASGVISEGANKYGKGASASESIPSTTDEFKNITEDFILNSVVGGALHAIPADQKLVAPARDLNASEKVIDGIKVKVGPTAADPGSSIASPPISEDAPIPAASAGTTFKTELNHTYTVTNDGRSASRTDNDEGVSYLPTTRTFYVDPQTAAKVAVLEQSADPSGATPWLSTDGESLHINSEHLAEDLSPSETPTGNDKVEVPSSSVPAIGLYPIDVGLQQNGLRSKLPGYFGGKITEITPAINDGSVGAAYAGKLVPSQRVQKLIDSGTVSPEVATLLQQWGADSHIRVSQSATIAKAWNTIREDGLGAAFERITTRGEHENSDDLLALSAATVEHYDKAADFAQGLGDTEQATKFRMLSAEAGQAYGQISTALARGTGLHRALDPITESQKMIGDAVEEAKNKVAQEEGITRDQLEASQQELSKVDAETQAIENAAQEKAAAQNKTNEADQNILDEGISRIEETAKQRHEEAIQQTETAAKQDEDTATKLEEEHQRNFEEENKGLKEALDAAQKRLEQIQNVREQRTEEAKGQKKKAEARITELEGTGQKRAKDAAEAETTKAEAVVKKLKENKDKGAKVSPEAIAAAEKNLSEKKARKENVSVLDGMTAEEKKEYKKLLANKDKPIEAEPLKASELKEEASLKEKIARGEDRQSKLTPKLPDDVKKKIDSLRETARTKREEQSKKDPLDRLKVSEKKTLTKLKETKANYPKERTTPKTKADILSPEEKARLSELAATKKKLEARKAKVDRKVQEAVAAVGPDAQKLKDVIERANSATGSTRDALHAEAFKIKNKGVEPWKSSFWKRFWTGDEISGPNTFFRKTFGEVLQAVSNFGGFIGNGEFRKAADYARGTSQTAAAEIGNLRSDLFEAWKRGGYDEAIKVLNTHEKIIPKTERKGLDNSKGGLDFSDKSQKRLFNDYGAGQRFSYDYFKTPGLKQTANGIARALNTVFGGFSAGRAIYVTSIREGFAYAKAVDVANETGKKGEALRQAIGEALGNTETQFKAYLDKATKEAADLKQYGINWDQRDVRVRAAELMDEARSSAVVDSADAAANYWDMNKKASGWVGGFFRGLQEFADNNLGIKYKGREVANPASYLFRFLNITGNLTSNQLEWLPLIGHFKGIAADTRPTITEKNSAGENIEKANPNYVHPDIAKNIIGKANLGTALTAALIVKLYSQKDDKNPFFDIHGRGPTDPASNKVWRDDGHTPFSIEINTAGGRKSIPLPVVTGPIAMLLGLVGSVNDGIKYDQHAEDPKTAAAKAQALGLALGTGVLRTVTNEPFLRNWGMLIDAYDKGDATAVLDSLVIQPAKGFIPLIGMERYLNKFVSNPVDSYHNLYAKVLADTPLATLVSGARLNAMGEPIKEGMLGAHSPLANYLISQNTDPDFGWLADNGWHIPPMKQTVKLDGLVGEEETDPTKSPGAVVANILTPNERAQILQAAAPEVRSIVQKYREALGSHPYDKAIQSEISKSIDSVRNKWKYELFVAPRR